MDEPQTTRALFDEEKRQKVVAMIANGSSRRVAATMVGCAPSTITRAAARDPAFAEQLVRAERNVEVQALQAVRNAARQPRYWRAAAWVLERKNPDDFAQRPPRTFNQAEVLQILSTVCEMFVGEVPEENCRRAQQYLDRLMVELRDEISHEPNLAPPTLATPIEQEPPATQIAPTDADALNSDQSAP